MPTTGFWDPFLLTHGRDSMAEAAFLGFLATHDLTAEASEEALYQAYAAFQTFMADTGVPVPDLGVPLSPLPAPVESAPDEDVARTVPEPAPAPPEEAALSSGLYHIEEVERTVPDQEPTPEPTPDPQPLPSPEPGVASRQSTRQGPHHRH